MRLIEDASQRQAEGDDPNHYIDRASAANGMPRPHVSPPFEVVSHGFKSYKAIRHVSHALAMLMS